MKQTLVAMLKFNALMVVGMFAALLALDEMSWNQKRSMELPLGIAAVLLLGFWIFWNLRIVVVNRQRLKESITDKALDAAAAALDFRDAARSRIDERRKERQGGPAS